MTRKPKTEILRELAREGLIRARDLDEAGIPRTYLRRMCDEGTLERIDRGLYRMIDAPVGEHQSLAEVAARVPKGIICLLSALQVHDLTTEAPHAVWLMIDRHARTPSFSIPKIEVVRASGRARTHGVQVLTLAGTRVQITTPAKTVADCFRYRHHVGLDVAIEATRDFLRKHRGAMDELVEAARADRVYTLMRPYIEALV